MPKAGKAKLICTYGNLTEVVKGYEDVSYALAHWGKKQLSGQQQYKGCALSVVPIEYRIKRQ